MVYDVSEISRLIDQMELCHHKAERHVQLIIEAIARGMTTKGAGRRDRDEIHPAQRMWNDTITLLLDWLAGRTEELDDIRIGPYSARELAGFLGERTVLKQWQVQQIVRKLKATCELYPSMKYQEMIEHAGFTGAEEAFRDATVATIIHDTVDGQPAQISLGAAIDHLEPCNWNFPENLALVLRAINGDLHPQTPFAAHGRNVRLNPLRGQMLQVAESLRAFGGQGASDSANMLRLLGAPTPEKVALAAKLEQKIRETFA